MFKSYLSEAGRERLRLLSERVSAMFYSSDLELGCGLMELAREAQAGLRQEGYSHVEKIVYDPVLAWDLIPEVAFRLGVQDFREDERQDSKIRDMDVGVLRERVGANLMNCGSIAMRGSLLTREPANGNPLVFAIDRLASPCESDVIAARLREVASLRDVVFEGAWTIDFLSERRSLSTHARPRG